MTNDPKCIKLEVRELLEWFKKYNNVQQNNFRQK